MNNNRWIIVSCGVILFVACLCLSIIALSGAIGIVFDIKLPEYLLLLPTQATSESTSPESTPSLSLEEQMDAIQAQVISLRGLSPNNDVLRTMLTPEELRQHVVEDFLADYTKEEASKDALELAALGLLEPNFALRDFYIELFSEQIAGFYDHETNEMYVVQEDSFKGPERLTYAHEYTHVLQDQNYDFQNKLNFNDDACEADSERCAAIQALIEGDATLVETQWFTNDATPKDRSEVYAFYQDYASPIYDSAPPFMKEDFLFAYQAGQVFVTELYNEGGWEAVNEAYSDPPLSTEQILHPEKYPSDKPEMITLPALESVLGAGWEEIDRGVMGEWYTYLILARGYDPTYQQDDEQSKSASAGWDGDVYAMVHQPQGDGMVFIMITEWETVQDASEFNSAMRLYTESRFGEIHIEQEGFTAQPAEGLNTIFRIKDQQTIWILASDMELAQAALQAATQE